MNRNYNFIMIEEGDRIYRTLQKEIRNNEIFKLVKQAPISSRVICFQPVIGYDSDARITPNFFRYLGQPIFFYTGFLGDIAKRDFVIIHNGHHVHQDIVNDHFKRFIGSNWIVLSDHDIYKGIYELFSKTHDNHFTAGGDLDNFVDTTVRVGDVYAQAQTRALKIIKEAAHNG